MKNKYLQELLATLPPEADVVFQADQLVNSASGTIATRKSRPLEEVSVVLNTTSQVILHVGDIQ